MNWSADICHKTQLKGKFNGKFSRFFGGFNPARKLHECATTFFWILMRLGPIFFAARILVCSGFGRLLPIPNLATDTGI